MMFYLCNKVISEKIKVKSALCKIFGINSTIAESVCLKTGINPNIVIEELDKSDLLFLENYIINNCTIEDKLKIYNNNIIEKQINIKKYKGIRKIFKLPSNGQRTHSNAKTARKIKK